MSRADENYNRWMKFMSACEKVGKEVGITLEQVFKVYELTNKYMDETSEDKHE